MSVEVEVAAVSVVLDAMDANVGCKVSVGSDCGTVGEHAIRTNINGRIGKHFFVIFKSPARSIKQPLAGS